MAALHIVDIESAINWWRDRKPSPDGISACDEVRALASVYGLMVYRHESLCDEATLRPEARDAWLAWYATTPDAPCIAICSTSQGDAVCKGCGRSFDEVQHWTGMSPAEKRAVWRRITTAGTAWRFNRYAERSGGSISISSNEVATGRLASTAVSPPTVSLAEAPASVAAPVAASSLTHPSSL